MVTEYKPKYLDNNYDEDQKKVIPLPPEKIAQDGYFGVAKALSEGTPDFGYCIQAFAGAISADHIRGGGKFLEPNDFVGQLVIGEKALPLPLYIENKQTGATTSMSDILSMYGLFFGFLYMNGLITTSGMEKIGKKAHDCANKDDLPGSLVLNGYVIDDLKGMFNQGPKALYDLWIKQLAEYYYIEWDRDDPQVGNECLALTKDGIGADEPENQKFGQRDSGTDGDASESADNAPKKKTGILRGLFGRK